MDSASIIALASTGVAALIAICVPYMTFRFALRQDQARWLRDQRAALYVDLLTEAYAEERYIEYALAGSDVRRQVAALFDKNDVRLPPLERARLGARGSLFGSKAVNQLFNEIASVGGQATLGPSDEGRAMITRVQIGGLRDRLQTAVREELGADRIDLKPPASAAARE